MEKYSNLSLSNQKELIADFCEALINLKNQDEAANFLIDLLTKEEVLRLAKRIKIAQLLLAGKNYQQIKSLTQSSDGTIAKIANWLSEGGEGFKLISKRHKISSQSFTSSEKFGTIINEWKRFKRSRATMFWPSLLIESIIESADKEEKGKMFQALGKLDHKSKIYKDFSEMFKS